MQEMRKTATIICSYCSRDSFLSRRWWRPPTTYFAFHSASEKLLSPIDSEPSSRMRSITEPRVGLHANPKTSMPTFNFRFSSKLAPYIFEYRGEPPTIEVRSSRFSKWNVLHMLKNNLWPLTTKRTVYTSAAKGVQRLFSFRLNP